MNFLSKTFSSLTGPSIPYNIGEEVEWNPSLPTSLWRLFEGTKKDDSSPCSILQAERDGSSETDAIIHNALDRMRRLRLPGVLKVLDTFETSDTLYIMTEPVTPLLSVITTVEETENMLQLIVFSVTKALKFINVEGGSVHGRLDLSTVFVTQSGEIKLGGFELCSDSNARDFSQKYQRWNDVRGLSDGCYLPAPELEKHSGDGGQHSNLKIDSWKLGCFIYSLFNGQRLHFSKEDLAKAHGIPKNLVPAFKKLTSSSPTIRSTVEQFWKNGLNTYLHSQIIDIYEDLDQFNLKTEDEKIRLFESLDSVKNDAPPGFLGYRIVPELVTFFNQSPTHAVFSLRLILSYSEDVTLDAFIKLVKPVIIKAFSLPDRQIRMILLASLPQYIDKLDKSDVTDRIFTPFITGFSDSNAAIREESVKAVLHLSPKLSERQLNNDLLRFLAKTQADEVPEIRCNTTICIGKIATHLNKSSRPTVLATAFSKGLKDPFIPSRLASIMALSLCLEYFSADIIANKILTVIAPALLDKSSKVRDEAQKAFDQFFQKIKQEALKLPVDKELDVDGDSDKVVDEVTANVQTFGISFSNTFSKLTSNLGGSLNPQSALTPSPEDSRAGTPQVVESFKKVAHPPPPVLKTTKPKVSYSSWGDEADEIEADDGWGVGEELEDDIDDFEEEIEPTPPKSTHKPTSMAPNVTKLVTEEKQNPQPKLKKPTVGAKKGMQLKKSKINLKLDDDGGDDGWGDGW